MALPMCGGEDYTVPFGRFYGMWREGSGGETRDPYMQPFVVATP